MPIYEYRCRLCGEKFEKLMRIHDPDPVCPGCGADNPKKLISNTYFSLKGTGWYATDYAGRSHSAKDSSNEKERDKDRGAKASKAGDEKSSGSPDSHSKTTEAE